MPIVGKRFRKNQMIEGQHIIYFGPGPWEGMWRNRHQILHRLSKKNKVVYVERPYGLKAMRNSIRQDRKNIRKIFETARESRFRKFNESLYIYRSPSYAPITGRYPFDSVTWWIWTTILKLHLKKLAFTTPIIWLSKPGMHHLLRHFNERLSIYHIVDEYLAYPGTSPTDRKTQETDEKMMLDKVDLSIVVSKRLFKNKSKYSNRLHLIPNAVDAEAYTEAQRNSQNTPTDIASLPRPIVGYTGLISVRLDLELLFRAANQRPDVTFALIGTIDPRRCENIINRLGDKDNVFFLGLKEIQQVPFYVSSFDVNIIPYKVNEETKNLSSLKLYDSLAAGKPVVTTDFSDVDQFKDVICIADSGKEFMEMLDDALTEKNDELVQKRKMIAAKNSWKARVNQISAIIEQKLAPINADLQ